MSDSQAIWIASFLIKLYRGEIVQDAASAADRAEQEYIERFGDDE